MKTNLTILFLSVFLSLSPTQIINANTKSETVIYPKLGTFKNRVFC